MKIWLDDERPAPEGYTLTRTVSETIELLKTHKVSEVHLDNDLGNGEPEGRTVMNWIEQHVVDDVDYEPPRLQFHTDNGPALEYMKSVARGIKNILMRRSHSDET